MDFILVKANNQIKGLETNPARGNHFVSMLCDQSKQLPTLCAAESEVFPLVLGSLDHQLC